MNSTPHPLNAEFTKHTPLWNLLDGVAVARKIEDVVVPLGYHVALGGSTLYAGESNKDLDIFLYNRSGSTQAMIETVLHNINFMKFDDGQMAHSEYGNSYHYRGTYEGKRVDVFFLVKIDDERDYKLLIVK